MYMYLNDIICVSLICKKNGLFYSGIICDIIILKLQMEVLRRLSWSTPRLESFYDEIEIPCAQ